MCLIIDFKERTGVQFGADVKRGCDEWKSQIVRAPFIKRHLEAVFGLPVVIQQDGGQFSAGLNTELVEICNSAWDSAYAACSSPQTTEAHAIAHLNYLLTTKLGREQSVIRQVLPEGAVREFKYDLKREVFYSPNAPQMKVHTLGQQPKVS